MPRHTIFAVAAVLLTAAGCGGGGSDTVVTPGETGAPETVFFGIAGTPAEIKIQLKNKGAMPLIIKNISVSGSADFSKLEQRDNCTEKTLIGYGSCDFTAVFSPYVSAERGMTEGSVTVISDSEINPSETITLYGYGEGRWSEEVWPESSPPEARYGHAMTAEDNILYIFGGTDGTAFMDDLWGLNKSGEWKKFPSSLKPEARTDGSLLIVNGNIYLFGGQSLGTGEANVYFNDLWVYNYFAGEWELFAEQAETGPKADKTPFSNAVFLNDYIYSIQPGDNGAPLSVYKINVKSALRVWEHVAPANAPALYGNLKANSVIDGKIYVFGISKNGAELWRFDTERLVFEKITLPEGQEMPEIGNGSFSVVQTAGGFILIAGDGANSRMWSYTPAEGFKEALTTGWTTLPSALALKGWACSFFNKHIVRFGGQYITADGSVNTNEYVKYE